MHAFPAVPDMSPVLFFDGVCGFCNAWVDFLLKHDRKKKYRFAALQSPAADRLLKPLGAPVDELSTAILLQDDRLYFKADVFLRVMVGIGFPWCSLGILRILPLPVLNWGYDFIARHRYRIFGKRESCRIPSPDERSRFLAD
jgi:predicted DCC family thiol-disulfide oxidoreductase YuxK